MIKKNKKKYPVSAYWHIGNKKTLRFSEQAAVSEDSSLIRIYLCLNYVEQLFTNASFCLV